MNIEINPKFERKILKKIVALTNEFEDFDIDSERSEDV